MPDVLRSDHRGIAFDEYQSLDELYIIGGMSCHEASIITLGSMDTK